MAGIHLPDIGKLGIRVATGMRDKKKVAPSNMAENARFQALATRLDTEKHERSRVLKKEERRMKRKKHRIDKRRQDIQKNKKQEINSDVDTNDRKRFLPLISHPKTASVNDCKDDLLSEDQKDLDEYSGSPSSAIFPIQDALGRLLDSANGRENRASEKRKIILPSIETGSGEGNVKCRKTAPLKKKSKKNGNITNRNNNILERNFVESTVLRNSQVILNSPEETKTLTISNNSTGEELEVDTKVSSQARKKEVQFEDETQEQIKNGTDLSIDESELSANPFNYLLLEEQRRKALHQNLEDAFRAIKTCRYIRTPSRREKETDDE
ncbi:hypothetical protein ACROYT_G042451 [Oculina patagonica]